MTNDLVSDLLSLKPILEAHHCRTDAIDRAIAVIGKRPASDDLVTRLTKLYAALSSASKSYDADAVAEAIAAVEQHTGLVAENEGALRLCGYCQTWNSKPCGEQCRLSLRDPTWEQIRVEPPPAALAHPQGEDK